jgi:hypothetical protein
VHSFGVDQFLVESVNALGKKFLSLSCREGLSGFPGIRESS